MEGLAVSLVEMFEFMQPFCSAAIGRQAAFESSPFKSASSFQTQATETDMTDRHESSFAQVHYEAGSCDTSLTSSISEDEIMLTYNSSITHLYPSNIGGAVPQNITFFTPKQERTTILSRLALEWHVRRSVGGHKGIDQWTGRICEVADSRQDTDGSLGQVTCFRISPNFVVPASIRERQELEIIHPHLAGLSEYMSSNLTLPIHSSTSAFQADKSLFGLPLVLVTDVQVAEEYRGLGLGLLLVDETCRCLAYPAQWVLLATEEAALRDYFGLLGFTNSGMLDGQVVIRWNDPFCMATHRYEDLCPHLPRVAIQ